MKVSIKDTQHNNALPLCWVPLCWGPLFINYYADCHYAECRYAESCILLTIMLCHYAECRYAECHYAECCSVVIDERSDIPGWLITRRTCGSTTSTTGRLPAALTASGSSTMRPTITRTTSRCQFWPVPGKTNWKVRLSTVDLHIKAAFFVKEFAIPKAAVLYWLAPGGQRYWAFPFCEVSLSYPNRTSCLDYVTSNCGSFNDSQKINNVMKLFSSLMMKEKE